MLSRQSLENVWQAIFHQFQTQDCKKTWLIPTVWLLLPQPCEFEPKRYKHCDASIFWTRKANNIFATSPEVFPCCLQLRRMILPAFCQQCTLTPKAGTSWFSRFSNWLWDSWNLIQFSYWTPRDTFTATVYLTSPSARHSINMCFADMDFRYYNPRCLMF